MQWQPTVEITERYVGDGVITIQFTVTDIPGDQIELLAFTYPRSAEVRIYDPHTDILIAEGSLSSENPDMDQVADDLLRIICDETAAV